MIDPVPFVPPARLVAGRASPGCRASVIIPVRDEQETLWECLAALAGQVDARGRSLDPSSFEVIVLANNCRDGSAALAGRFAESRPGFALRVAEVDLPTASAHVGTARKMVMDEACRRLIEVGRPRGVIASTDGDTRVAPGWLAATLRAVDLGADAVGGDVRTDRAGRASLGDQARRAYLGDVVYGRLLTELEARIDPDPGDPWPRHHHHTGASLAVTAEAYRLVGGLPPLPTSEDLALVRALRRSDLTVRHCPAVRVVTSTRRIGRARSGMADTLNAWADAGRHPRVESPAVSEARFRRRRRLREFWQSARPGPGSDLTPPPGFDRRRLIGLLRTSPTFAAFLESAEAGCVGPGPESRVEIAGAIAGLRERLSGLGRTAASASTLFEQVEPVSLLSASLPVG